MSTPPPESLESVFDLARAGDLGGARAACARWLEAHPDDARGHWVLGNLEGQGGRPAEARVALERAVQLEPGEAAFHGDLGMACLALADPAAAAAALSRAVELAPDDGHRRLTLAVALQRSGRQDEGVAELERCLERLPDHPVALASLGVARLDEGRTDEARALLERATVVAPDHGPTWRHYARALLAMNRLDEADTALATARRLAPSDPDVRLVEAAAARARDRLADTRERLEEAAGLAPGRADIEARLAELDGLEGRAGDGLARLRRLPETTPAAVTAVAKGRLEVQAGDPQAAMATVAALVEQPGLPAAARADLLAIRGDARAGLGDHAGAVADWCAGKALRPGTFDANGFSRLVDALIEAFPAGEAGRQTDADGPLLIVGLPRSGKSLLEQVLASHPDVSGAGESSWLGETVAALPSRLGSVQGYPACLSALDESAATRLGEAYRAHLATLAPAGRWIATTLPGNLLHLGLLARIAPGARVIVMDRDPLDTGVACLAKPFVDPALAWSKTPAHIGHYLAELQRLLAHWEAVLPLPILRLSYEDLVTDVEAAARRALDFLGLAWDERCLSYHEAGASRLGHSPAVGEPLDGREVGSGQPYAGALAPLVERLSAGAGLGR